MCVRCFDGVPEIGLASTEYGPHNNAPMRPDPAVPAVPAATKEGSHNYTMRCRISGIGSVNCTLVV